MQLLSKYFRMFFCRKHRQADSKFIWKCKGPKIAKTILKKNKQWNG